MLNIAKTLNEQCFILSCCAGDSIIPSTIQVTVDDELRADSDKLFKGLGIDTTSAIRIFLKQAVMYQGFPFAIHMVQKDPFVPLTEDQFYEKLNRSRMAAAEGKIRNADNMVADMKAKYGL